MIQIIAGEKGKGKTKILLDKVNAEVKDAKGSIFYLDKTNKHMYELNTKIRLINVKDYCVEDSKEFLGFIYGLIAGNHDLEKIYLDSFMKLACMGDSEIAAIIERLETISTKFQVDFVISISVNEHSLPETVKKNVIVAL